jgi:hypothetical protein
VAQRSAQFLVTIEAADHRAAKTAATKLHPCVHTVVMPHRPTNEKLERAVRKLDQRTPRDRQRFGARRR